MSTTPPTTSYGLGNALNYYDKIFQAVLKRGQGILPLIRQAPTPGVFGQNKRYYWPEFTKDARKDILNNSGAVSAADTTFTVTTGASFKVGNIIKFHDYLETMRVTGITGNVLTVTRNVNGVGATTTVADGASIDIFAPPMPEWSTPQEEGLDEMTTVYNNFQKFRKDLPISGEALLSQGIFQTGTQLYDMNLMEKMELMRADLNAAILFGERADEAAGTNPTMRGIYTWLMQAGTNKTSAALAELTAKMINDLQADVFADDANAGDMALFMDETQARKMATFNTAVANQIKSVQFTESMAAGNTYVTTFRGDLPAFGESRLIVDRTAQPGTVALLNMAKVALVYAPNGRMSSWDSKSNENDPDAKREALRMIATLEMRDHTLSHGLIYNLDLTPTL